MTKEEIYKATRNHAGDIRNTFHSLDFTLLAVIKSYRPETEGMIDALKDSMDYVKGAADEVKALLDQWPH